MTETELNDAAVLAVLGQLSAQLADMPPAMQDIGDYKVKSTRDRFAEGVAPDGTPWAPNVPERTRLLPADGRPIVH